jgi:3-hydroxyacyl-CoA dehydrogenase
LREKQNPKHEEVVVLGANGTMGAGAAEVFAAAGYHVTMLAREVEKAREGLEEVQQAARAEAIGERIQVGSYARNLSESVARAAIVFESLAEDLALKQQFFEKVDQFRKPDSIVATVSSGLSIAQMAEGRSDSFRRHFLGIHLFNPPNVIVGTEVIPHTETDPAVVTKVVDLLQSRLGRRVIVAKDRPAFVGNRVGFKVLNEVAHLASEHGVAFMDYLIGPQTGRAMAPLATIDLVGWDVHKAIVDNVYENTEDEAHRCFELPAYMREGLSQGRLGDKTPVEGGFYRRQNKRVEVLNPQTNSYQELKAPQPIDFVERMRELHRVGRYPDSLKILAEAKGDEAELARRVVLGYVSYALNRVGEVAETNNDVDIIMSYGFNWAPPSIFVDLWGPRETLEMMSRYRLKAPRVVEEAASKKKSLYAGNILNFGRTFYA